MTEQRLIPAKVFFKNITSGKRYEIVKVDKATGDITLKGPMGIEFVQPYDKAQFKAMGYILEKENEIA